MAGPQSHFSFRRPAIPSGGATFRIESMCQLSKKASKRYVCTLPFRVTDNTNEMSVDFLAEARGAQAIPTTDLDGVQCDCERLTAKMKFSFLHDMTFNVTLLLTLLVPGDNMASTSLFGEQFILKLSGKIYHKSRDEFYDLWSCKILVHMNRDSLKLALINDMNDFAKSNSYHSNSKPSAMHENFTTNKHKFLESLRKEGSNSDMTNHGLSNGSASNNDCAAPKPCRADAISGSIDLALMDLTKETDCGSNHDNTSSISGHGPTFDELKSSGFVRDDDRLTVLWNVEIEP